VTKTFQTHGSSGPRVLLSIVTVCFNAGPTIKRTLSSVDSALREVHTGEVEHLVVDGQSQDDTLEILVSHTASFRRVVSESDRGIYDAMNKSLRLVEGDYVWFLNADDALDPGASSWIPDLLSRLSRRTHLVFIGEVTMFIDVDARDRVRRRWKMPSSLTWARRLGWHPPHPAFIANTQLLLRVGGFDESKRIAADYKLMMSCLQSAAHSTELIKTNFTMMKCGGVSTASWRAIVSANLECYRSLCELGYGRLRSAVLIAAKLLRKVAQRAYPPLPVAD
jgi:glycosyltransferase involved in cell wall biosynthesis